jgi:hypothetical protein
MQAAMAWGYRVGEWHRESVVNRAKALTHYLHSSLREAYSMEKSMNKGKGKGDGKMMSFSDMMASMKLKKKED